MRPFVSVIIPCYNEERYIGQLIRNILSQDYPSVRMEVLIVDGMSSDRTTEIIPEFDTCFL